ncbi:hypothetical protein ACLH3Q_002434 [Flavobacterium psychrophilum]|nr:hypothetical protein FPSM_00597 [Flavobacterium psychrophilum]
MKNTLNAKVSISFDTSYENFINFADKQQNPKKTYKKRMDKRTT